VQDLGRFGAFAEIDHSRLDEIWDAVLDKGQVCEVDPCRSLGQWTWRVQSARQRHTEEGHARRTHPSQGVAVQGKVLLAGHERAQLLERCADARTNLAPGAVESVDGAGAQAGDDGHHGCVVVEVAAFLHP
jgi:hypothetical protein